ncbi:MAG: NADPH-dependent FMN reductase [Thalassolituus sp.]|jgi:NAD(P)H-dependent FMN reductase
MKKITLLALSGSLRRCSYNTATLEALAELAPEHIHINIGDIGSLPLFNPDREDESIPEVSQLKAAVGESSGLIIASPEYAHGISGPMKNALDWLVSGEEFPYKPIMLINTSPRATHAQAALTEVLTTMSGNVVEDAYVALPLLSSGYDKSGIINDLQCVDALATALNRFVTYINP